MTTSIEDISQVTACYARKKIEGRNSLREMGLKGKLNIRGNASDDEFVAAVEQTLEVNLPRTANTVIEKKSRRLFWLGPDEWLLHCDLDETDSLTATLRLQLQALHHAVTDVSDYYTVLRLRGPDAADLIARGCPLDLHHSAFPSGDIAQTRFGHASILLHRLGDGESWDLQVRWTYAEYLWDYLVCAMDSI